MARRPFSAESKSFRLFEGDLESLWNFYKGDADFKNEQDAVRFAVEQHLIAIGVRPSSRPAPDGTLKREIADYIEDTALRHIVFDVLKISLADYIEQSGFLHLHLDDLLAFLTNFSNLKALVDRIKARKPTTIVLDIKDTEDGYQLHPDNRYALKKLAREIDVSSDFRAMNTEYLDGISAAKSPFRILGTLTSAGEPPPFRIISNNNTLVIVDEAHYHFEIAHHFKRDSPEYSMHESYREDMELVIKNCEYDLTPLLFSQEAVPI